MLFLSLKRNELFKITIPAKLQTYLSLNKPIFGLISGETSKLISSMRCGITADSGNYNDAAKKIIKIINNKNILKNYFLSNTTEVKKQFYFKNIYNDLINLIDQK